MDNIDNYIYLDICEILYFNGFKKTKFSTFSSFCNILKHSIDSNDFRHQDYIVILKVYDHLKLVYALEKIQVMEYLVTFLEAEPEIKHQFLSCVLSSQKLTFSQ